MSDYEQDLLIFGTQARFVQKPICPQLPPALQEPQTEHQFCVRSAIPFQAKDGKSLDPISLKQQCPGKCLKTDSVGFIVDEVLRTMEQLTGELNIMTHL